MATYDLEEQEQLDELKTWWKMYGNIVTGILFAVALAAAGCGQVTLLESVTLRAAFEAYRAADAARRP